MKKIALMIVAAATLFAVAPASAQAVVIDTGMHRDRGLHRGAGMSHRNRAWHSRAQYRNDYGRRHHRSHRPAIVIGR
jgi:Ni/Co efflux regulator RcnB